MLANERELLMSLLQELLVFLLQAFAQEYNSILILLEDIHLFDTISLQLVTDVTQQLPAECLILTTYRPSSGIFANTLSQKVI